MTDELRVLCALTGEVLFGQPEYEKKEELNWETLYALAWKQSVAPTVVYALPESAPEELCREWINDAYEIEQKNYRVYLGNLFICRLLRKNRIPFVILKGLASASYYRKPYFRSQGDVDFLVPTEMAEKTRQLLLENGFQQKFALDYEIAFTRDEVSYELHLEVNGIPEGEKGIKVRKYLENLIPTAVPLSSMDPKDITGQNPASLVKSNKSADETIAESAEISQRSEREEILIPDEFHHGLIILLHTAKHLVGFGMGLRQLSDWAVFIDRLGERFPEVFEQALMECGLWEFARALSAVCISYFQMQPLGWTGTYEKDFLERFMEDLTRKGGIHHDEEDQMDTLLVEKTDQGGTSDVPMYLQLLINLGRKAQFRWPWMKKIKVLIPFGVMIMCIQYGAGMITGKYQKINLNTMVKSADSRKALYKELKLFE